MLALPPHSPLSPARKTCAFELDDTAKCQSTEILARGYCASHYAMLRRAGAFTDSKPKPHTPTEIKRRNVRAVKRAHRKLLSLAPDFVDDLKAASKIAAIKGDSGPAQWAILHTRTVDPVSGKVDNTSNGSTTINIGVKVSGVK